MKYYNYKKAKELVEQNKESIQSASLGMHEDWFWTGNTIFENGEYSRELFDGDVIEEYGKYIEERKAGLSLFSDKYDHIMTGGIAASEWATPTLQIIYKAGNEEMLSCYIQDSEEEIPFGEKIERQIMCTSGCISSEVQANISPLEF